MRSKNTLMRRIVGSRTLRMICAILFILNTVILICSTLCFSYLKNNSFYATGAEELQNDVFDRLMEKSGHDALLYFHHFILEIETQGKTPSQTYRSLQSEFLETNCNFFFVFRDDYNDADPNNDFVFYNYYYSDHESARDYYPEPAEFFDTGENANLIERSDSLTFEGHLKKTLTAHDAYWRASCFFRYANALKYVVLALMIASAAVEGLLTFWLYSAAGNKTSMRERDLDQIPLYYFLLFWSIVVALCAVFLYRQTAVFSDLTQVFSETDLQMTLYVVFLLLLVLAALVQVMVTTVSVRVHRPLWWRRSILYRTFAARSFGQRARTVLSVLTVAEFSLYFIVYLIRKQIPSWVYIAADGAFALTLTLLLYVVWKDMAVYIPQTRRIAAEKQGFVATDNLSDSGRKHAENINFLSHSASAETERRYINESFSAELIYSVSNGLREPLKDVAENVRLLESGTLTEDQSRQSIAHIISLSQDLKKTIEDMILISKASTGNLPLEPVPTDTGMMLSQAVGEFDMRFAEKGVTPVTEQPGEPVQICVDGQYMWYVFEGILSVMLENAVSGTRLFLRAMRAGDKAVIVFRCTVRTDARLQSRDLSGMGLASAKVFTMLQGGVMKEHLSHDTLTAVLQFPAVAPEESE